MKFSDFTVGGFGVWSGLELRDLSPQLTVLWGPNEAGKTTILECVRGVLYGFSPVRRERYLPPVHGGMGGGTLRIQIQRESHEIVRVDDRSRLLGGVTVIGPDGSTQGEPQLKELLQRRRRVDLQQCVCRRFARAAGTGHAERYRGGHFALRSFDGTGSSFNLGGVTRTAGFSDALDLDRRRQIAGARSRSAAHSVTNGDQGAGRAQHSLLGSGSRA